VVAVNAENVFLDIGDENGRHPAGRLGKGRRGRHLSQGGDKRMQVTITDVMKLAYYLLSLSD